MSAEAAKTPFHVTFFRHIIPAAVVLGGILVFALDRSIIAAEGAAGIIGAGLAWWLFGWLYRQGQSGDKERDAEAAARDFFDEHGRWPSDEASAYFAHHGRWPDDVHSRGR